MSIFYYDFVENLISDGNKYLKNMFLEFFNQFNFFFFRLECFTKQFVYFPVKSLKIMLVNRLNKLFYNI